MPYYPSCCETDIQKAVYDELVRLSDKSADGSIDIHELEPFEQSSGFHMSQIHETVAYFNSKGLLNFVVAEHGVPLVFGLKRR